MAVTVRFPHRDAAQAFVAAAREAGAHVAVILGEGAGHHVTVMGEAEMLDRVLVHAAAGEVLSRQPLKD